MKFQSRHGGSKVVKGSKGRHGGEHHSGGLPTRHDLDPPSHWGSAKPRVGTGRSAVDRFGVRTASKRNPGKDV